MTYQIPELSIIIISYNTSQVTSDCLLSVFKSLEGSTLGYELIVLDNNSTDGSPEAIQSLADAHPQLRLIRSHENLGFGRGNNRAVMEARGKTILLLNSDTVIIDDAIERLFSFYSSHRNPYQFVGPKLLNLDGSLQPSAGLFFTLRVVFAFLFLGGDRWGLTRSSPSILRQVDWVSGAAIICNKEYFLSMGGFDEEIFMYMEEVDLLYRASQKGYKTGFYPEARLYHIGSASSTKTFPILQVYRGLLRFYKTHRSPLARLILRYMLQLKAVIAWILGKILGNQYLTNTYAEAFSIAQND